MSTARLADKIRFKYEDLETHAEGTLDTRGRKGLADDVPVHYKAVRLIDLVAHYCPVDSLIRAAVPDYEVAWERM